MEEIKSIKKKKKEREYNLSILKELAKSAFVHPLIKNDPYTFAFLIYNASHIITSKDYFTDKSVTIKEIIHDFNNKNEILSTTIEFYEDDIAYKYLNFINNDEFLKDESLWLYINKIVCNNDKTITFYYNENTSFTKTMKNLKEKVAYKFVMKDEKEQELIERNYELVTYSGILIDIKINKKEYSFIQELLKKLKEKHKIFTSENEEYFNTTLAKLLNFYKSLYFKRNEITLERSDKKITILHGGYSPDVISVFRDSVKFLGEKFEMEKMNKSKYLYFG
jgi:hypothetical protein